MNKVLKIYTYNNGNVTPFPNDNEQIEVADFSFSASRMGGTPVITTTIKHRLCLDSYWTGNECVRFNGEDYFLLQTPTSKKDNTDARYEHKCEFVSARISLENVYVHDTILKNNKLEFSGDVHALADRLNKSLQSSGLQKVDANGKYVSGYVVIVDKGVTSESKFFVLEKTYVANALQEGYKQFEIPYYYVGKEIHIGFSSNTITTPLKYGANDALLSITKNNVGSRIINRCTGTGSEENIPYYYPNEHPLGIVDTYLNGELNNHLVVNKQKFAEKVKNSTFFEYKEIEYKSIPLIKSTEIYNYQTFDDWDYLDINDKHTLYDTVSSWFTAADFVSLYAMENYSNGAKRFAGVGSYRPFFENEDVVVFTKRNFKVSLKVTLDVTHISDDDVIQVSCVGSGGFTKISYYIANLIERRNEYGSWYEMKPMEIKDGKCRLSDFKTEFGKEIRHCVYIVWEKTEKPSSVVETCKISVSLSNKKFFEHWVNGENQIVNLESFGLTYGEKPNVGDKITFQTREGSLIPYKNTLMPSVYRESKGEELFYDAINDYYELPSGDGKYVFANPYNENDIREHEESFDFIKPSIENIKNDANNNINMFAEFAYDDNDNDDIDEEKNEYVHPYFYAKLHKTDGEFGFNIFESANEKGEMTISMTSGDCGSCQFVVMVDEKTKKNTLQVDDNGALVYENGRPKFGTAQDKQNDTISNYVWIALKKDASTYSNVRPNATYTVRPKACTQTNDSTYNNDGDTFVITNISLPKEYILAAEKRLDDEIIAFMKKNNDEKFTFAIKFSRIFLAENPSILNDLNENATINVEYNGVTKPLYVTSYTYKASAKEALPEISVEVNEELVYSQNSLQRALSKVEHSILQNISNIDFYKQGLEYFIRKDIEDYAREKIHFQKGATFGENENAKFDEQGNADFVSQIIRQYISTPQFIDGFAGAGFKLWLDENGKSNLTVDNITAREAFRVFEMLVTKLRAVNGGLFVSAANGTIKEVIESEDGLYYDIVLENDNTFIEGDYMRCQVMSGLKMMDYWVEIHSVQNKTCRVLKSEFGDVMPLVGQDVVLDGSKNENRQSAIYITANEDGLPRIEVLDGINKKNHNGCLRTRLGSLNYIVDATFGGELSGYGLYSDNAYLKGEFIVKNTNQSVETMFAVQDSKIQSSVSSLQTDIDGNNNFLRNASFTNGFEGWETNNTMEALTFGNELLFLGNSVVAQSVTITSDPMFKDKFYLNINNGWIKQSNALFMRKPDFDNTKFYPLYFSTNVRCKTTGVLTVKLLGAQYKITTAEIDYEEEKPYVYGTLPFDINGFVVKKPIYSGDVLLITDTQIHNLTRQESFPHIYDERVNSPVLASVSVGDIPILTKELLPSNDFIEINKNLMWTGDLDFYLEFTGEADFYGLTIFTEKTEVKYSTLFEQTDKLVRFASERIGEDGNILNGAEVLVKTEGDKSGTYLDVVYQKDGETQRQTLGEFSTQDGQTKIKLSGDNIILEGDITANGKVSIDSSTGKLSADEATFTNVSLKSSELLDNREKTGFTLKIDSNGLKSVKTYSDGSVSDFMQLGVVSTMFGANAGYLPRLLFTNGYKTTDENIVCNTSLMYNNFIMSERRQATEFMDEAFYKVEITPQRIFFTRILTQGENAGKEVTYALGIKDDGSKLILEQV